MTEVEAMFWPIVIASAVIALAVWICFTA